MFSLGGLEIAVICLLAIVLFPPHELPKLARSVARVYGTIRRTADDFRRAVLHDPDLNQPIDEIKSAYRETRWQVRRAEEAARRELSRAQMQARQAVSRDSDPVREPPTVRGRVPASDPASGAKVERSPGARPPSPLAIAVDPPDDGGGDDPARDQGAA